jgi:hypothetical protein
MTTMTLYGGPLDGAERPVYPYGITYCEATSMESNETRRL